MKRTIINSLYIMSILCMSFVCNSTAFAQSGKDAFKALKRIDTQLMSGVSFSKYSDSVSDATLEVQLFLDDPKLKNSNLPTHLKVALDAYQLAKEIWTQGMGSKQDSLYSINLEFYILNEEMDKYSTRFPVLKNKELETNTPLNDERFSKVLRKIAQNVLWLKTSEELKKAQKYLAEK